MNESSVQIEASDRAWMLAMDAETVARKVYNDAWEAYEEATRQYSVAHEALRAASVACSDARFVREQPGLGGRPYSEDYTPSELSR